MLLVVGLLAGSAIGFAVAQAGKSVPPAIVATDFTRATSFTPACDCPRATAAFSVTVAGSPTVSVRVVKAGSLAPVRELAKDVATDQPIALVWDGRTDAGQLAPAGRYRVQVLFPGKPTRTLLDIINLEVS